MIGNAITVEEIDRLRRILKHTGMSQRQLVRELGREFNQTAVSEWLNGSYNPNAKRLVLLREKLPYIEAKHGISRKKKSGNTHTGHLHAGRIQEELPDVQIGYTTKELEQENAGLRKRISDLEYQLHLHQQLIKQLANLTPQIKALQEDT